MNTPAPRMCSSQAQPGCGLIANESTRLPLCNTCAAALIDEFTVMDPTTGCQLWIRGGFARRPVSRRLLWRACLACRGR